MKTILCIGMLTLMAGPHVFGLVRLGGGQIDFNLQLESAYDTEIRARNSSEEDFIFTVRPSLVYSRSSKNIDISASVGFISRTYLDYDEYSDTDVSFDLSISPNAEMRTSRIRSSASLILNTETRADDATGEIIPVQHYTGGLADTVELYDPVRDSGTGFLFEHATAQGLRWALGAAIDLFERDRAAWTRLMLRGMSQDYSWERQGREYLALYARLSGK